MKIPKDIVEEMRQAISQLDTEEVREAYRTGNFPRSEFTKDLDKRYRWDLLWATMGNEVLPKQYISDTLYEIPGVNDSHIDTALRNIVSPL
jgi:hypothetical protein